MATATATEKRVLTATEFDRVAQSYAPALNALKRKEEVVVAAPTTKDCPYCLTAVPIKASRCGHCTSELKAG